MREFVYSATTAGGGLGVEGAGGLAGDDSGPAPASPSAPSPAQSPTALAPEVLRQAMEQVLADIRISGAGVVRAKGE